MQNYDKNTKIINNNGALNNHSMNDQMHGSQNLSFDKLEIKK